MLILRFDSTRPHPLISHEPTDVTDIRRFVDGKSSNAFLRKAFEFMGGEHEIAAKPDGFDLARVDETKQVTVGNAKMRGGFLRWPRGTRRATRQGRFNETGHVTFSISVGGIPVAVWGS